MASESGTLYVGMTNHLLRRVEEHKSGRIKGFSQKYGCKKLVYYEDGSDVYGALEIEKQIKRWRRSKKFIFKEEVQDTALNLLRNY